MALRSLSPATAPARRPLIVTTDPILLDKLVHLAAAGGVEVSVSDDPVASRGAWCAAPFVLLGAESVGRCARAGLPARAAVIVVTLDAATEARWQDAEMLKAEQIAVLPMADAWLVDRFADLVAGGPTRGRVVAVLGGRGGAGASVLATALAVTGRRRGLDVLLIDADPLGGGVDLVLGWERMEGLRWPDLVDARGRVSPPALVGALPGQGSLAVLSFDRSGCDGVPVHAMAAAVDAGRRGRDLVVIDLPRRFDESSLLALTAADRGYLVVPAEIRACAAALGVAKVAVEHCPALGVVVRGPTPGGVAPATVAHALRLPLVGTLRSEPRLARALEGGQPPAGSGRGPLAELCRDLLAEVSPRRRQAVA